MELHGPQMLSISEKIVALFLSAILAGLFYFFIAFLVGFSWDYIGRLYSSSGHI
jgi:hypothetical protein